MTTKRNVPPIQITRFSPGEAFKGEWVFRMMSNEEFEEFQRLESHRRHAARPPWSWSVPYRARPKVKR